MKQLLCLATFLLLWSPVEADPKDDTWALLVGCSKYPYLSPHFSLKGTESDVLAFKSLITSNRFGVPESNIRSLLGWGEDESSRPTLTNIKGGLSWLKQKIGPKSQVLILLAGHGSQQPADDGGDIELDGLDEIFLPADVKGWDDRQGHVAGALVDDDLGKHLDEMRAKGASVWLIMDSCHSGTMSRGTSSRFTTRGIDLSQFAPKAKVKKPKEKKVLHLKDWSADGKPGWGSFTGFYASRPKEKALELPLPEGGENVRGLLSYSICDVLQHHRGQMDYRLLMELVVQRYRSFGIYHPTPTLESSSLNQGILGHKIGNRPLHHTLMKDRDGSWFIQAGSLHGISVGSMYQTVNSTNQPQLLKVTKVEALRSKLSLSRGKVVGGEQLELLSAAPSTAALRVNLVNPSVDELSAVKGIAKRYPKLLTLGEADRAHAKITFNSQGVQYFSTSGVQAENGEGSFFLSREKAGRAESVANALLRIARAKNLLHLGGKLSGGSLSVSLDIVKYRSVDAEKGEVVPRKDHARELHPGNIVGFRIKNTSRSAINVSLLMIDSNHGIQMIFPFPGSPDDNRLEPGQTIITPKGEITDTSFGEEHLVAICMPLRERVDFSLLEQPGVAQRAAGGHPLLDMMGSVMNGTTRGFKRVPSSRYGMNTLTWKTVQP